MTKAQIVNSTADFIKQKFASENSGHDYWHMFRVWKVAKHIAKTEKGVDMFVLELGALLHDIDDWKFNDGNFEVGAKAARDWLESLGVENNIIEQVEDIIRNVSFKGANVKNDLKTIEGQIVHDADKLDAIGAIGIARAFAYGGANQHVMFEPKRKAILHDTFEAYKNDKTGTINHFYDKLLLLKGRMFTKSGKSMAATRHQFMEGYLRQFHDEWKGKL